MIQKPVESIHKDNRHGPGPLLDELGEDGEGREEDHRTDREVRQDEVHLGWELRRPGREGRPLLRPRLPPEAPQGPAHQRRWTGLPVFSQVRGGPSQSAELADLRMHSELQLVLRVQEPQAPGGSF